MRLAIPGDAFIPRANASQTMTVRTPRERWSVRGATVALGVVAFGVGYAVTYLRKATVASEQGIGLGRLYAGVPDPAATWQVVAWLHVGAHYVPVWLDTSIGYDRRVMVHETAAWDPLVTVVPVVALLSAGAAAVWMAPPRRRSGALARGVGVAVGYFVVVAAVAVVGNFRFATERGFVAAGVAVPNAVVVAGVALPATAAGLGGVLAHVVGGVRSSDRTGAGAPRDTRSGGGVSDE